MTDDVVRAALRQAQAVKEYTWASENSPTQEVHQLANVIMDLASDLLAARAALQAVEWNVWSLQEGDRVSTGCCPAIWSVALSAADIAALAAGVIPSRVRPDGCCPLCKGDRTGGHIDSCRLHAALGETP